MGVLCLLYCLLRKSGLLAFFIFLIHFESQFPEILGEAEELEAVVQEERFKAGEARIGRRTRFSNGRNVQTIISNTGVDWLVTTLPSFLSLLLYCFSFPSLSLSLPPWTSL